MDVSGSPAAQARDRRHVIGRFASDYPVTLFCVLAYLFSWSVFLPVVILGAPPPLTILATLGPSLAALIATSLTTRDYRWLRATANWRRAIGGTLLGVALVLLAYVVLPAIGTAAPSQLNWRILIATNVYNYSTILGGPLGEEPGWRGYALPRLEHRYGPIGGTLLLALIWTGWHLPLLVRPGWESAPLWIYVLIVTGLSVIMTYAANLTRFNLITAIVMHAAFNTAARFVVGLFATTQPATTLPFELVLALSGLVVGLVLIVVTRGRLAYKTSPMGAAGPTTGSPFAISKG